MSETPLFDISVAIVTFNNAAEIASCLRSIEEDISSYPTQVVIVDNASGDDTVSVVESLASLMNNKLTLQVDIEKNETNLGFTKGLNQALRRCRGDFILVLNPDTELLVPCLPILLQKLANEKRVGIVAAQLLNRDGSIQKSCRRFPSRRDVLLELSGLSYLFPDSKILNAWKMGEFDHKTSADVEQPQGAFLLFKRSLLEQVGLWDERFPMFFSDVDWCYRVKKLGYNIRFETSARVMHHKGASIYRNRGKMIWTSHRSFYRYFKKHKRNILLGNHFLGLILLITAGLRVLLHSIGRTLTFGR